MMVHGRTSKGQTSDAHISSSPAGNGIAQLIQGPINIYPLGACLDTSRGLISVESDIFHPAEIKRDAFDDIRCSNR